MEELLRKLKGADRICREANVHYEKANSMEQETVNQKAMQKKAVIKWVIIGIAGYYLAGVVGGFLMNIPLIGKMLGTVLILGGMAGSISIGIKGYRKEKASLAGKMEELRYQAEKERAKAQEIFEKHAEELAFLPVDYWYPVATDFMAKAVQTQRAATLAEAIDKFEEQLHRWKIEEANSQMVNLQQQQTAHLASIKTSSKISAAANVTNTIFNIASRL